MKTHPKNPNVIYCERHKGYFFSRKLAETGKKPTACPKCKRQDWEVERE